MSETPLSALIDDAREHHPDEPRRIADALCARAATLPDDADGTEALRLAEHVLLAHLGDVQGLRALLEHVPASRPALAPALERARWAIAACASSDDAAPASPGLPHATRWRALQNVVLARARLGDASRAARWLCAEEHAAAASTVPDERIAYAACANNVASELRLQLEAEAEAETSARAALMLQAATIARRAWERAGTWMHVERAEHQLALCHAALGQGTQALHHARQCLAICEVASADAAERFFAHEAMARAHRSQMRSLLADIGDEAMQAWCRQTLQALGG